MATSSPSPAPDDLFRATVDNWSLGSLQIPFCTRPAFERLWPDSCGAERHAGHRGSCGCGFRPLARCRAQAPPSGSSAGRTRPSRPTSATGARAPRSKRDTRTSSTYHRSGPRRRWPRRAEHTGTTALIGAPRCRPSRWGSPDFASGSSGRTLPAGVEGTPPICRRAGPRFVLGRGWVVVWC